ncbi:DUF2806 domain-containing protein [Paraburkholderia phenoliruptrix]|uniref:Membrane-fusion protein n=2 Tax=Paraburkholderia phenoliruptrix TaxID=252970 RepID=K0DNQ1_9BURK|nr:DUF2806 domain-containing protein [Paraburkholderia phenoliruptrix]AFT85069.1 membrane-fusion protein [Paraburkholderia phenoliruptrix BR3459a]MDR6422408.1 hypothetical protein [Paraburkholderia phenoliruptrix]CAB4050198.1 hypothetical protein LMG9964_03863 [Paraburkholderia phenoliruptrix]
MDVPGEKLLIKMWESLADRGIGSLLKPWHHRRESRAQLEVRRNELLLIAQAEKDAEEIRAGKKKVVEAGGGSLLILSNDQEVIDGRAEPVLEMDRLLVAADRSRRADALREEINVAKTLAQTEQLLSGDNSEPGDAKIETDWLYRWRDCAAQVSTEELQSLWAKVLADEVKAPGAFSLRTLDFLKNLSRTEAEEIQGLCPFVVNGQIILTYGEMEVAPTANIDYPMRMQELGLISGAGGGGLSVTWRHNGPGTMFVHHLIMNGRAVTARTSDLSKALMLGMYRVTPLGTQVLSLNPAPAPEPYVQAVAQAVKNMGFETSVATCIPMAGRPGQFHLINEQKV